MATKEVREKELRRIYERDGYLQASTIVKEATPKRAPLHDEFEWDDKAAAYAHRLDQARRMIRVTCFVEKTGARHPFVHVPVAKLESPTAVIAEREGIYRPIKEVVKDPGEYVRALRELETQRAAMERTIQQLKRAARAEKKDVELLPQLQEGLTNVKHILQLMIQEAA